MVLLKVLFLVQENTLNNEAELLFGGDEPKNEMVF